MIKTKKQSYNRIKELHNESKRVETVECAVCRAIKPITEMRNVYTLNRTAESPWIYACKSGYPFGLGGSCFGKYSREIYLENNVIQICECAKPKIHTDKHGINFCRLCKNEVEIFKMVEDEK